MLCFADLEQCTLSVPNDPALHCFFLNLATVLSSKFSAAQEWLIPILHD